MSDLTFSYLHMTDYDLKILDTFEMPEYMKGEMEDDELDIPLHMVPLDPEEQDQLPGLLHPSYPQGNPTSMKRRLTRIRPVFDPMARSLMEEPDNIGIYAGLRWKELALKKLLPVDENKLRADRATQARKMASGATSSNQRPPAPPNAPPQAGPADLTDNGDASDDDEDDEDGEGLGEEDEEEDEDEAEDEEESDEEEEDDDE